MTDQPKLYRVQTTDGKIVAVQHFAEGGYIAVFGLLSWKKDGQPTAKDRWPAIDLDTLTRLHLLTDEDLQKRDAEFLERAAVAADDHTPGKHMGGTLAAHVTGVTIAAAIRAMKGTKL